MNSAVQGESNKKPGESAQPSVPRGLTAQPIFAVVGVLLGALISVFTGRLLSVGSADIQGALGVSSDYMSWVQTAYNAANMFIGPLTVYLGAFYGVRRVLLWASAIFILAEFASPFVAHNQIAFLLMQTLAGLAAGTYYPLTFTIIIRNFPLKYVYWGVAIYTLDILASTHFGHLVESFYVTNLGWQWLFWNALLVAPLLMLCVYFGIPRQPLPVKNPTRGFAGFLYAASALTSIYVAIDQGERLDWFNSVLICALVAVGAFFLLATIISRYVKANPMVNLSFIRSRNFLLLGGLLVGFRFVILASTLLVPGYLAVLHAYRPEQTASVLAWISIPQILFAPLAGYLLSKVDSRLLAAIGFTLVGIGSALCAQLDPGWTGETFFTTQIVISAGLTTALAGIVASLLRSALAVGALKNPVNILTLSCWFQVCRLFGGELGKSFMTRFLKVQNDFHSSILSGHIDGGWLTEERITLLAAQAGANTSGAEASIARSAAELGGMIKQQVALLSYSEGFMVIAIASALTVVAAGFITYTPPLVEPEHKK